MFHPGYISAFDGLRVAALAAVLTYHLRLMSYPGILFGVDLFFALSGFLITGVLLKEFDRTGSIACLRFYLRRVRRLLPPLLTMVVGYSVWGFFRGKTLERLLTEGSLALLGVSNWTRALGSYIPRDLAHTWSLSIEFQFCFLSAPFLLLVLRRWKTPEALAFATLAVFALLQLNRWGLVSDGAASTRIYNGTDTRIDAFLLAAASRALLSGASPLASRFRGVLSAHGVALLVLGVVAHLVLVEMISLKTYVRSVAQPVAVILSSTAIVLALAMGRETFLHRVLSLKPVRYLGQLSYGIYLWHYPLADLLRGQFDEKLTRTVAIVVLSLILAALSYHLVEQPLNKREPGDGKKGNRRQAEAEQATPVEFPLAV